MVILLKNLFFFIFTICIKFLRFSKNFQKSLFFNMITEIVKILDL